MIIGTQLTASYLQPLHSCADIKHNGTPTQVVSFFSSA